jgi:hypothetical protein
VELITGLITGLDWNRRPHGLCAEGLLAACTVLRILSRDRVAVGLCGIEETRAGDVQASPGRIEFRIIVLIANGLDEAAAAEAADRLVDELAASMNLPIRGAEFRLGPGLQAH